MKKIMIVVLICVNIISIEKISYANEYENIKGYNSLDLNKIYIKNGFTNGEKVGIKRGNMYAHIDYFLNLYNNWTRYSLTNKEIENKFELYREKSLYKYSFIQGYRKGFKEEYTKCFQELNFEEALNKLKIGNIPISGGRVCSNDGLVNLFIHKGCFYDDVIVTINKLPKFEVVLDRYLVRASNVYSIKIFNKLETYNENESIQLSFEYYGSDKGGIYKLIDNSWVYIPSKILDDRIVANINPKSIQDNALFCVLIDKNAYEPLDIRGHWAKNEINTFLRRKYVSMYENKRFRPDNFISKKDFLNISYKLYKFNIKDYVQDISQTSEFISYSQVQNIMKKVTKNDKFNWNDIAYSMMYSKDIRCKSLNDMNNNITRAEAIYMLYKTYIDDR